MFSCTIQEIVLSLRSLTISFLPDGGNTVGERMWGIITKMVKYEIY